MYIVVKITYNIIEVINMETGNVCAKCGAEIEGEEDICGACTTEIVEIVGHKVMLAEDWVTSAKELGLDLWERQPQETEIEWNIWLKYRDAYPFVVKPKAAAIAKELMVPVMIVNKVAERWDYTMRLQAWARFVDKLNIDKRQQALVEMNERHISMARKINDKLDAAIDGLNVDAMKFTDFKAFMAMATELERKASVDIKAVEHEQAEARNITGDKDASKKAEVKKEDMQEVLDILSRAGVLKGPVGIRQVTTTEVLTHGED